MLDHIDKKLIQLLATDARASLKALAQASGLSAPSVTERLKRLEERGILTAYDRHRHACAGLPDPGHRTHPALAGAAARGRAANPGNAGIHRMRQGHGRGLLHRAAAGAHAAGAGPGAGPLRRQRADQYGDHQEHAAQTQVAAAVWRRVRMRPGPHDCSPECFVAIRRAQRCFVPPARTR